MDLTITKKNESKHSLKALLFVKYARIQMDLKQESIILKDKNPTKKDKNCMFSLTHTN